MAKSIFAQNEALKDKIIEELTIGIPSIESKVYDEIMSFIDQFDSIGGNFSDIISAEHLNEIEQRINDILVRSGYVDQAQIFIRDFGKITINTTTILNAGGFDVNTTQLSAMESKWQQAAVTTLLQSGIREDFTRPIQKIIDDSITYGDSINTARQKLKDYVIGGKDTGGKLKSYLTQTARDSISQMQGQQMQSVANALDYVGITYTGGLLKDSRGQCTHWINDLNGFIPKEQLREEIRMAYANQTAKRVDGGKHKWGGMMPDTNTDNFCVKRGGYNCTHTAIPKRKK
jgi:hypothetical protein